ncbi:biopolymer transporter ExbD [Chondromyces apiculatus]|uniref:Biopolymer transport protein ExbD/TolR n=1 Tax=Chondromyces apiculatus DSM 436 TaxID=1192034 RepID=A0A017T4H1_9BACT|nr:biopolymer transporter ExbD [Chondromyces apiculatus]EYF03710.1 Biopolymer transport protein ExbD/TolR [Chondromyces apiculatus DSM 436]
MSSRTKKFVIRPSSVMNSDINVTPLVDVVLVLLIIFMVVTPLLEKDIAVRVPDTEKVETTQEVPKDQLLVRVLTDGNLRLNTGEAEFPVTREDLVAKLKEQLDRRRREEDKVVFVVAEDGANYGGVVSILDVSKGAGASVLGMMTEAPEEDSKDGAAPAPPPAPAP